MRSKVYYKGRVIASSEVTINIATSNTPGIVKSGGDIEVNSDGEVIVNKSNKAVHDNENQEISNTYIKGISILDNKLIYIKGDGTTGNVPLSSSSSSSSYMNKPFSSHFKII